MKKYIKLSKHNDEEINELFENNPFQKYSMSINEEKEKKKKEDEQIKLGGFTKEFEDWYVKEIGDFEKQKEDKEPLLKKVTVQYFKKGKELNSEQRATMTKIHKQIDELLKKHKLTKDDFDFDFPNMWKI